MKFDKNKAFPYPVLRPFSDDYIDIEFQATVDFAISGESIDADISFALSSDEIHNEIGKGNAAFLCIVSCRDTYFQEVLSTGDGKIAHQFDPGSLRGEVRVDPYIVVLKGIDGFTSPDINPEFGKASFSFTPGDVLAQDETQVFYIDRDLFKPLTSIFDLVKSETLSGGEWKAGLEEDHVQIEVSPQIKESIDNARNDKQKQVVLLNSLYYPAVIQALQRLKESASDYDEKRWAKVIKMQLHNAGWALENHEPYVLAQRLMKHPMVMLETYILKGKD